MQYATETDTPAASPSPPVRTPLHPAHPDAEQQPVLIADLATGTPTWIYPPDPKPAPVRDPWPARLVAGGVSVSLPIAVAGILADELATLTAPAFAAAACAAAIGYASKNIGGRGQQQGAVSVNVNVDNRGR